MRTWKERIAAATEAVGRALTRKATEMKMQSWIASGEDWTTEQVVEAIHAKGLTRAIITVKGGVRHQGIYLTCIRNDQPHAEEAIATALGLSARQIWPSRWQRRDATASIPSQRLLDLVKEKKGITNKDELARQIGTHPMVISKGVNKRLAGSWIWPKLSDLLDMTEADLKTHLYGHD